MNRKIHIFIGSTVMKKFSKLLVLFLAIVGSLASCGGGSSEEVTAEDNVRQTLEEHDSDQDGALSPAEIREAHVEAFALLDADGDGDFDANDFGVPLTAMEPFDTDGNGIITVEEFVSNGERLALESVDHNDDDIITEEEMLANSSL